MAGEPFDCPQMPFGGAEDFTWSPDGSQIIYVCKKKHGKEYAVSTNTDIYRYTLASQKTENLSEGMNGYDVAPQFSADGKKLLWLSMANDGFEADKNDIIVLDLASGKKSNLTAKWDGTVASSRFAADNKTVQFLAVTKGTEQLFTVPVAGGDVKQVTKGQFDINGLVGQHGQTLVVTRADMNHAGELFTVNLKDGAVAPLTNVNDDIYGSLKMSKVSERWIKTTDGKDMLAWVIYPPDFDPNKNTRRCCIARAAPRAP